MLLNPRQNPNCACGFIKHLPCRNCFLAGLASKEIRLKRLTTKNEFQLAATEPRELSILLCANVYTRIASSQLLRFSCDTSPGLLFIHKSNFTIVGQRPKTLASYLCINRSPGQADLVLLSANDAPLKHMLELSHIAWPGGRPTSIGAPAARAVSSASRFLQPTAPGNARQAQEYHREISPWCRSQRYDGSTDLHGSGHGVLLKNT